MSSFKARMMAGEHLAGTFVKTPAYEIVEVLAHSGLDFLCFDAEHAPFDRARLDSCLAMARALGIPALVRVGAGDPDKILAALDSGATGIVVPHVGSAAQAQSLAKAAHFGNGGRGFAGSTRWAGFATAPMKDILARDDETVMIAQIEEPEAVEIAQEIAAIDGIDGLFAGPADLSVCLGLTDANAPEVRALMRKTAQAAAAQGKPFMTFAGNGGQCAELAALGASLFFIASDHGFMLAEARRNAEAVHALKS